MLCNSILKNIINTYVKHLYCIFIKLMEYSTLCYIVLPNYIPLFGVSLLISFLYTYCTSVQVMDRVIPGYFTVIIGVLPWYLLPTINWKKTFLHFCPFSKFCHALYFEKSSNTIKKTLIWLDLKPIFGFIYNPIRYYYFK